jgi:hypothetical protein
MSSHLTFTLLVFPISFHLLIAAQLRLPSRSGVCPYLPSHLEVFHWMPKSQLAQTSCVEIEAAISPTLTNQVKLVDAAGR